MRKLHLALGLLTLSLATDALANYKESYYAGIQGGRQVRGITRTFLGPDILVDDGASSIDFGARLYAGYQMNEYFSFELGYGSYHNKKYKVTHLLTTYRGDVVARGADAELKAVFPIFDGFNIFGKAGVAFINQTIGSNLIDTNPPNANNRSSQSNTGFLYGFGGGYDFDEGRIEIGATRMNAASAFPTLDFVYIGISGFFF